MGGSDKSHPNALLSYTRALLTTKTLETHCRKSSALLSLTLHCLQEKKRLVFESTVGGSNEALARLTEADMRFLFN